MAERQHCLQAGDSLPLVAEQYDLPGWQALYFSGCNLPFRQQHPNPWNLPEGAVITIPQLSDEQRQILNWRMGMLEGIEKDVSALAREQLEMLHGFKLEVAGGMDAEGSQAMLGRIMGGMARTTVKAMHMVKFHETGMSTQNGFLLLDALERLDVSRPDLMARISTLLARASDGIVWGIEPSAAQAWCDSNSSFFWGTPLLLAVNGPTTGTNPMQLLNTLHDNCKVASANVSRELRGMRSGALSELGKWFRLSEARGGFPPQGDDTSEGDDGNCACPV